MNCTRNQAAQQETVTQADIENLLAEVRGSDTPATTPASPVWTAPPESETVQPCRFRRLSSFSAGDLRKLRLRHEEFLRSLAARLSIGHRLDFGLQMSKMELVPFQKFADSLANPTHLTLLRVEPLRGVCLLDLPPGLSLLIVEREVGGSAMALEEPRELTEIEARLVARVVETIASEWCGFWRDLLDLRPVMLGHENSGRFLRAWPPETLMLVLGIEARMGETAELIQFAFPHFTLEPLIQKLNTNTTAEEKPALASPLPPPKWNLALNEVRMRVTLEFPPLELSARQLVQLKPGDVLPLSPDMARQVRVCLERRPVFTSILGSRDGRWAAQITGKDAGNGTASDPTLRVVQPRATPQTTALANE